MIVNVGKRKQTRNKDQIGFNLYVQNRGLTCMRDVAEMIVGGREVEFNRRDGMPVEYFNLFMSRMDAMVERKREGRK